MDSVGKILHNKALYFAKQLRVGDEFKAGDSWLASMLKDGNKKSVQLYGEAMEISPEQQQNERPEFLHCLTATMDKYNVTHDHLYNTDQTGPFFNKLQSRIFIDRDEKNFRGVK